MIIACDPSDYDEILSAISQGDVSLELRKDLALKAFQHTASYDSAISNDLAKRWIGAPEDSDDVREQSKRLPSVMSASANMLHALRYGENSHQAAALYREQSAPEGSTLVTAKVEGGKAMSYNNYSDADATLRLCRALSSDEWPETPHACVIVKHNNPCGAALGATQAEAYEAALASDPESAFGSIICVNEPVTMEFAEALAPLFLEVLIAPAYEPGTKEKILEKKNRRLITIVSEGNRLEPLPRRTVKKSIEGGWLVQTEEAPIIDWANSKVVTKKQPTAEEIASMRFAVKVCEQVKSNAIVLVQGLATVGIGPGQTSRVEAVRIASRRAGERAKGSILASDAFFPFKDGIEQAAEAGVSLIVQPGGSIRDNEVIEEADACNMSMLFTGHRLFRH